MTEQRYPAIVHTFASTQTQNARGEWVPAIPEPYFLAWGRIRCQCGDKFRNRRRYREHFALAHILATHPTDAAAAAETSNP